MALLASSAFLASAASTSNLQSDILAGIELGPDPLVAWTFERWSDLFKGLPPPTESVHSQRRWDAATVAEGIACLRETLDDPRGCACLLAVSAEHVASG